MSRLGFRAAHRPGAGLAWSRVDAVPRAFADLRATFRSAGTPRVVLVTARARGVKIFASDGMLATGQFADVCPAPNLSDLSRPASDVGAARGGIPLHFAAFRSARRLSVSRCAAKRPAMRSAGPVFLRVTLVIGVPPAFTAAESAAF